MGILSKSFKGEVPISYWIASTGDTGYPALKENIEVDTVIIGGGITGLTLAYLLKKKGTKTVIIEANRIAKGVSAHTTAKITSQHSLIYDKLIKQAGMEKARQYADANQAAIDLVESIINENSIDCDFERLPAFIYTQDKNFAESIGMEAKAAVELDLPAKYVDDPRLPFNVLCALRFDNQAQFHPRKYLLALAEKITSGDDVCRIFEYTRAVDIKEGSTNIVVTDIGAEIKAKSVVMASHYPFYNMPGLYFTRVYPERSYLLGVRIKGSFPHGMFINAEYPTRSMRECIDGNDKLLIVGGENHKTGHGSNQHEHYNALGKFAAQYFDVVDIPYRWSAQDYTSMDDVPIVGRLTSGRDNIYVAVGFNKWGMSNGTAAAQIIYDLIVNGDSPWASVYNPSRFSPVSSAVNFIKENADVAKSFITGKLNVPPESVHINNGEAAIAEIDGRKVAYYKDMDGNTHYVSPYCTHLGCELKWNSAELSWDCPCHGSRFTYTGEILDGPALKNIKLR